MKKRKHTLTGSILFLLAFLPSLLMAQLPLPNFVNYDFNSGSDYPLLNPQLATGISSYVTGSVPFDVAAGIVANVPPAFLSNPVAGNALSAPVGGSSSYWEIGITGIPLNSYSGIEVFFHAHSTNNPIIDVIHIDYSIDGAPFQNMGSNNLWFDLWTACSHSLTYVPPINNIRFRIWVNAVLFDANMVLDNFQARGSGAVVCLPPSITCPANPNPPEISLGGACSASMPNYTAQAAISGNCPPLNVTQSPAPGSTVSGIGNQSIILTVTDAQNQTATCSFSVPKVDITPPVITCPAAATRGTNSGCTYSGSVGSASAIDNCDPAPAITSNAPANFPLGNTTVIWTATDASGRTATCSQQVTVIDDDPPQINCPQSFSINNATGMCGAYANFSATATDNCASYPAALPTGFTYLGLYNNHHYFLSGTPVTWVQANAQAAAMGGYLATPTSFAENLWIRTAVDPYDPDPFWIGFTDQNYENTWQWITAEATAWTNWYAGEPNNLGGEDFGSVYPNGQWNDYGSNVQLRYVVEQGYLPVTYSQAPGTYFPVGATTVTAYTVDANGLSATCSFTVTVIDAEPPVANCKNTTVYLDNTGHASIVPADVDNNSTDNCAITGRAVSPNTFTCSNVGQNNTVVLTVSDAAGNTATCSATVTVIDNTPPVLTCPPDFTVSADQGVCETADPYAGYCDQQGFAGSFAPANWTLNNNGGNGSVTTNPPASITINGSNDGTGVEKHTDYSINVPCNGYISFSWDYSTADWCAYWDPFGYKINGTFYPLATSAYCSGGSGEKQNGSTVVPITAGQTFSFSIISYDNEYGAAATVVANFFAAPFGVTDNCGVLSVTKSPPGPYPVGNNTITWTAEDLHGNTTSCSHVVTVDDNQPPVITCALPAQVYYTDPGACTFTVAGEPGNPPPPIVDNFWISLNEDFMITEPSGGEPVNNPGEDGLWHFYNQAPNNQNWWNIWFYDHPFDPTRYKEIRMGFWIRPLILQYPFSQYYYVVNWSKPGWTGPGFPTPGDEQYIERSPVNGPFFLNPLDPNPQQWVELTYTIPEYNPEWVSVDIWGQNVQIPMMPLAPPLNSPLLPFWNPQIPGGIIVHECLPKPGSFLDPTYYWDNCGIASVTNNLTGTNTLNGYAFQKGSTQVIWTVTDVNNLTASCSYLVNVVDNEPPVVTCPQDITVSNDPGQCGATVYYNMPVVTDNCPLIPTYDIPGYNYGGQYGGHTYYGSVASATYQAGYDAARAMGGHLATITSAGENALLATETGGYPNRYWLGATDVAIEGNWIWATGEPFLYNNWEPGEPNNLFDEDYLHFNWAYTGGWNDYDPSNFPYIVEFDALPVLTTTKGSGSFYPVGTTTVSYIATDLSGNTATCDFTITVEDNQLPSIACPQNVEICAPFNQNYAIVPNLNAQVIENCSQANLSVFYIVSGATSRIGWTTNSGGVFNVGYNLITYTVTDPAGNSAVCSFSVIIYKHTSANAGPDINTCIGIPVYVVGNIPTHGSMLWEQLSGPSTAAISQPSNYSTYVSNLVSGTYTLKYTITHGFCSSSDEMQIIVGAGPSQANAGPDQTYCGSTTSAVMAATPPTSGIGMWSQMSGPTTVSISNLFNPAATIGNLGTGIYVMKWAVSSGSCNPSVDYVSIIIKPTMTVNAGPDVLLAATAVSYYIAGSSAINYNSLAWTKSGTGFFNNATILHPTYYPSAADKTLGYVDLTLTGFQTGCQQKSDVMRITFKKDLELDPEAIPFMVTVMPNPFFDEANIEFTLPEAGFLTMKVIDMNGRIVGMPADKFEVSGTSLTRQIKAAGMAPGIYSWYAVLDGTEKQHFQSGRFVIAR